MIVCFNCDRETKKTLDLLIEKGKYNDYAEVISVAVSNLAILESEIGEKGVAIFTDNSAKIHDSSTQRSKQKPMAEARMRYSHRKTGDSLGIPSIFSLKPDLEALSYVPSKLPLDYWRPNQEVPLDRWLFGQYNKLLPVKASSRALANLLQRQQSGVDLLEVAQTIAEEATRLGDYLLHFDTINKTKRDAYLATAFPTSGNSQEKSQSRFANQFVGNMNKEGQLSGLLSALKFINRVRSSRSTVSLTDSGWKFAIMPNPLLDGLQQIPTVKFSKEEVDFLIEHIKINVPAENYAYSTILNFILNGENTPDSIDHALQREVSISDGRKYSSSFLSSQRSGAISRMTDIGLVKRERDGIRVTYLVTESGHQFVKDGQ